MLIATFNCNSVRVRLPIILAWLERHQPDVLALQETKCTDGEFPVDAFTEAGWYVVYRGEKTYNGVAVVTYEVPDEVSFGLGDDGGTSETRLACVRLGDVHVLNTYVPQGHELETDRFRFKLEWFARLRKYVEARFAERQFWGLLFQEPPRSTRRLLQPGPSRPDGSRGRISRGDQGFALDPKKCKE